MASKNLIAMQALHDWAFTLLETGFMNSVAGDALYAVKMSDAMLKADVEKGGTGVCTHSRQAEELLKLDTEARRWRAMDEAHTRQNLLGGVLSQALWSARSELMANIAKGEEDKELYGERTAREYRESEQRLREATGNPNAIFIPAAMRR